MLTRNRPSWYKPDNGLAARMVLTMFLLGAVYVGFVFALQYAFNIGFIPLLLIAVAIAAIQFFFSDKIALASMGAKEVSEQEEPDLHAMIARLAAQANLPKPRIAVIETNLPNAFATGRSKNDAVVAVTRGAMRELPPQELEAVLAHELTHIINRDMLVMTVATFFSMVISLIVQNMFWIGAFGGGGYGGGRRGGNNDNGGGVIIAILASVIAYVASFILIRTLSRYRELAADRGAALITGAPQNLASALVRIDGIIHGQGGVSIPQKDFRQAEAVNALFIVPALKGDEVASLFSTHPSTEERVARLNEMQRQMEQAHYNG
jgi:heat shock protein HtpX